MRYLFCQALKQKHEALKYLWILMKSTVRSIIVENLSSTDVD